MPTVVVDNGSTDGTVAFVRERFPEVELVEFENRGLAAGWNRAIAETDAELVLVLNADAWLVGERSLDALVATAARHPRAAVVAPRLLNTDGTLQRSVRGFPTPWRLATEYLYLRKLAPRSRLFNAFYGGGFAHDEERAVEWVMGAVPARSAEALDDVGALRRAVLPLQRGGRLAPACSGSRLVGRLHPGGRVRPRRRGGARRAAASRRTSRVSFATSLFTRGERAERLAGVA